MNVYFEEKGMGSNGDGTFHVSIIMYVQPTTCGHAFAYDSDGDKSLFAWVNPKKAKKYKSNELPKELWKKFRYGRIDHIEADYKLKGNKWGINDLKIISF